jgi:hypothetical protein
MEPNSLLFSLIEEDYGIKGTGRWFRSEDHSSLVYDAQKDKFYFNASDVYGDAYTYLIEIRKWSHENAKEYLKQHNYTTTFIQEIKDGQEVITYPALVDAFHENIWDVDRSYYYNRTLEDSTIRRFRLGYFNGFYTIPIFQDGVFKQIQMRRDSPKLIKNYYQDIGPLLFNTDILKITSKIYITEGLIGSIVLSQNNVPAISMNIGAEGFQANWLKYFTRIKEVYLLFDNDVAGNKGAIKTASLLGMNRCKIYNFWEYDSKGFAVDDYFIDGGTWDDLKAKIEKESLYAFEMKEYKGK